MPSQDREQGRRAVAALCAAFEEHLSYYKSSGFDETTARQRFIDPLFAALGWDVADEEKRGPNADVILEFSLRHPRIPGQLTLEEDEAEDERVAVAVEQGKTVTSIGIRRPDYLFRVNGERRFFVEAKRPSVDISTPRPVFQVKSYGWNARTSLAILTDFEDFLVFDCRLRPVLDEPLVGLLPELRLHFGSYVDKWDLLWDTFSREAVTAGSIERYAAELPGRKGILPVDQAFLGDFGRWRSALAKDLASRNPRLNVWELNEATQLTLDRLVFIRVCEDRRLEPEEVLRPLLDRPDPYAAFVDAIVPLRENYNGNLLNASFTDALCVSATVFRKIVQGLYTPWSPYLFDQIGVEILGSIYERVLASIITLDDERTVRVEIKPEVRKAGGVYYTPQWVVDEIVRLTVDPLIEGKRPRDLVKFRILDPACGSGSFLLGAFARLIAHYEDYYTEHPTVDKKFNVEDAQGHRRLTADAKAGVLLRHIFGVDVDPAAAEVTMMSLYLKSLESNAPEYVRTQMSLSGAILPSLQENIRVGNSLVSTDYYSQQNLHDLDDFEEHRLRPFKWESLEEGFGRIIADGGFDVVIGNPPYFNVDATYGARHPVPAYLKAAYPAIWQDKTDIYYFFLAKAAALASQRVGMIVSRAFLEADKAYRTRAHLASHVRLDHLVDFDGFRVFAEAGIATAIVSFDTSQTHGDSPTSVLRLDSASFRNEEVALGLRTREAPFEVFERRARLDGKPWRFPNPFRDDLFKRIDAGADKLSVLCVLGQGMQTAANGVFGKLTDEDVARLGIAPRLVKRRARNSDIYAFYVADSGENVLYLEDFSRFSELPKPVRAYLELPENKAKLKARAAYLRGDCEWWKFTWPLHIELHNRPRLVSPFRTGHTRFAIDVDHRYFTSTDTTVVFKRDHVKEDLAYIQGVLNSKLMTFRFRGLAKLTSPNMWESFHTSIKDLPIRRIDFSNHEDAELHAEVVRLASEIAMATRLSHEAASAADRSVGMRRAEGLTDRLDDLVLGLYGITNDEERASVLALGSPL